MYTLRSAKKALLNKEVSVYELTKNYIEKIKKNNFLNAYVLVLEKEALENAKKSDENYAKNQARELEGLPLAIKDIFCTKNIKTTACSKMLYNFTPQYESHVTQKLWDVGAIHLGKTNMDEFAMGSTNETSFFGPCQNPIRSAKNINQALVPGGSSGGSASAVAADICLAALGSDTGGSIRQPASFCGLVGLKPTYGRCSRYGMIAYASSLDQAGPMTKTVEDSAYLFSIINGFDPKDGKTSTCPAYHFSELNPNIKNLKFGIVKEYQESLTPELQKLMQDSIDLIQKNGGKIVEISIPSIRYSLPIYYIIASAEASSNLARYDGVRYGYRAPTYKNLEELYINTRTKGFGDEVKRRIFIGTYVLSAGYYDAYYLKAQKIRKIIQNEFQSAFSTVDAIITPTTPTPAFSLDKKLDPLHLYLNDLFTTTINIAELPALSVPFALNDDKLPMGLQIIAPWFQESLLFDIGSFIETNRVFNQRDINTCIVS